MERGKKGVGTGSARYVGKSPIKIEHDGNEIVNLSGNR